MYTDTMSQLREDMEALLEGSRKALRKEIEAELAKLKADYAKSMKEGAYTQKGARAVKSAIANIERLLKSNKLKGANNWISVAREEMIKAYDF